MKLNLLILLLLTILIQNSCNNKKIRANDSLENLIDSMNILFGTDLKYDSLKIIDLEKLIKISDSVNYPEGVTELAITGARICMLGFQNNKALDFLHVADKAMKKSGEIRLEALVNLNFGFFNFRIHNADAALNYYFKARQLSLEAKDTIIQAKTLMNIANLYLENGYLDKAREYFDQSIAINKIIKDYENLSIDYHRMSLYHLKKAELDSAGYYLETVLQTSKESENGLFYIYNLNNMASFQINSGNYDLGEYYSLKALHLMDSIIPYISPTSAKSVIYANLGLINQQRGDYQNALSYFDLAFADSIYNTDPKYREGLLLQLYQTQKALRNYNKADQYLERYFYLRDFNDKAVAKQNLLDMEMRYNFMQLQNENERKQYKMRLLFYSILTSLCLSIIILVMFIQKQRIKIKNVKLNQDINKLHVEKLNRELASQALNIARINERNLNLIKAFKKGVPDFSPENQTQITNIIKAFDNDKNEAAWNEFEIRFTSVHTDFYKKLSEINPNLTLNEKRLCAFLLLDMTTKEISSITGQTIRAIEIGRIRLRKQLGLTNQSVSLTSFLRDL